MCALPDNVVRASTQTHTHTKRLREERMGGLVKVASRSVRAASALVTDAWKRANWPVARAGRNGSSSTFWLQQQQQQDGGRKKKKKSRLDWTCPFSLFAREKRNKEHETGLEKEKNVSLRWRMPSLLLSVYSRAGYGPKDQDWTNGLDVATGWGSRRKKKRERIRVRRRHRSKRRRTGRGRWLVALTGGRLRRLYRSVSDSASSRVSLCGCVSFRFFFFLFLFHSLSLWSILLIYVFFFCFLRRGPVYLLFHSFLMCE